MTFLNIDPEPMMLPGFSRVVINGREKFARVIKARVRPANEDLAIVTVSNLPPCLFQFADLRNAILGLIENDYGLVVKKIQKCPFGRGQAYVRLNQISDRDSLIHHSPHFSHGLTFNFVSHNRGANARRVLFNKECWLMLIGYPPDDRSADNIADSIRSFRRMFFWQRDNVLARVIIKARVTDLVDIQHCLIISEGDDFKGSSRTVQCEIMQQDLLGAQLQDEDVPLLGLGTISWRHH